MVCCCMPIKCDVWRLLGAAPSLLAKGVRYLAGVGKSSTDILIDEANNLAAIRDDIRNAVSTQGSILDRNPTQQVEQWMKQVEDLLKDVNKFKDSLFYRIPCLKDCPCWATDLLGRVRKLAVEAERLKKEPLGEKPIQRSHESGNPQIVGREETVSAVLGKLENSDVKIIGIYGMPGIGKTAVLHKISHELRRARQQGGGDLSRVIYATVSREPNILNLQKDIAQDLGLPLAEDGPSDSSRRERQQARILFRKLSSRTDILLLDDVWECLNWKNIGIVSSDIGEEAACKIIFTTSSRKVCEDLGARAFIIKLGFLKDEESWRLFCQEAKKDENDLSIAPLKQVMNKCGGLPQAVITVSKHIASHASSEEMVEKWKHSPHEISGMKREVLSPLKCIFDKLEENSTDKMGLKQCLLYCSLFPEDETIYIDQLIDYWVGEGFLDAECGLKLHKARERGRDIISILMDECFLESTHDHKEVKLHDVVRGMALWLTDGESEQSRLFLTSTRLKDSTNQRWEKAERISSMDNDCKVFPSSIIKCPYLLTFLFNNYSIHLEYRRHSPFQHLNHRTEGRASIHYGLSNIEGQPRNLFQSAQALRVLDLSGTKIEEVPAEIGSIEKLQYLNISYTNVRSLPKELSKLKKLRQLKLRGTPRLSNIPNNSISPETLLQMFDLFESGYCLRPSRGFSLLPGQISLEDFSTWNFLDEIGLTITTTPFLQSSCSNEKLSKSAVFLKLQDVEGLTGNHLSSVIRIMSNLRELSISGTNLSNLKVSTGQLSKLEFLALCNLPSLSTVDVIEDVGFLLKSLRHLYISNCPVLPHITWVHRLPSLVEIALSNCRGVKELVGGQGTASHCSLSKKLREIHLLDLPNLRRIAGHQLNSPSLQVISVIGCPLFKGLSFDTETAANIRNIKGERRWWDDLQWAENDGTKSILENSFTEAH